MSRSAVFYDVDDTIVDGRLLYSYLYFAMRMPRISERMSRLLRTALLSPVYAATRSFDRALFQRIFYSSYKGMAVERLRLLGRELVDAALLPQVYGEAKRRIELARAQNRLQIFVSAWPDFIVQPLAAALEVDHVIANRLEFVNGVASGRLAPPLLIGEEKRRAVEQFAREHGIDLLNSYCFADSRNDQAMLEAVGFPCAVNADQVLEEMARERAWPSLVFA